MKQNILAVLAFSTVTLLGMAAGSIDSINHSQKTTAQLNATCKAQPQLDACRERQAVADGVRYFFNGQELQDSTPETSLGANK